MLRANGKAGRDPVPGLFRSLRTTKLCKISAKTKDFAAQTRCAQTYAAKSLTQIFYRASSLKLLQMPLKTIRCYVSCLFMYFEIDGFQTYLVKLRLSANGKDDMINNRQNLLDEVIHT